MEETVRRAPPPREDDFVEVIEEHDDPPPRRSSRKQGEFRHVDPEAFAGGDGKFKRVSSRR